MEEVKSTPNCPHGKKTKARCKECGGIINVYT